MYFLYQFCFYYNFSYNVEHHSHLSFDIFFIISLFINNVMFLLYTDSYHFTFFFPVLVGSKWILNKWIHYFEQWKNYPCTLIKHDFIPPFDGFYKSFEKSTLL